MNFIVFNTSKPHLNGFWRNCPRLVRALRPFNSERALADLKRWIFLFQQNKSNYAETHRAAQVQTNLAEETLERARANKKLNIRFAPLTKIGKKDFLERN